MRSTFIIALLLLGLLACKQTDKPTASNAPVNSTSAAEDTAPKTTLEKLYVHAANGLVLRKTPSKEGEKITTLAYKSLAVQVLETVTTAGNYIAERFEGKNIEGNWLRVRSSDGQEGFLFGGYLSKYPPVAVFASDVEILDQFYRTISPIKGGHEKTEQAHALDGYVQHYANGARFDSATFPGGVAYLLDIPAGVLGFQEAFVMLRALLFLRPEEVESSFDRAKNAFVAVHEGEGYVNLIVSERPNGSLLVELNYPD
jgi:Bacterial SH3 domain